MEILQTYLESLNLIHSSGAAVKETSYYGAIERLFNEVGKSIKPRVRCIINIADKGAGIPDGGLFTPDQFQKRAKGELIEGQLPSRGAIEIKPTSDDIDALTESEQVRRYVSRYRQVLVTNYWDFVLVGLDGDGNLVKRERFALATNEAKFWEAAGHSRTTTNQLGERFVEYLKRVMLHAAPLTQPKDVAWFLASYARDAKARIEGTELPALNAVRSALEEALGLEFKDAKGEHFFRSTLVQTLFYGVFSAWVLWSKQNPPTRRKAHFNWHEAAWSLHVPMIKALFEQVATPSRLQPLDMTEVLDWTTDVLNRVDRAAFFANFEEGHAVQYFYEPFLQAFDPELRKQLGVWYTPTEIVQYMVARVDAVLRDELGIGDGLADPRVYVLDPCCGTGAYLVEVLHKIHETLKAKGGDALIADDLKRAAKDRVFGFEILPAPFVVSHLQLGLLLQNLGAPLKESTAERVGVYLTNALNGWEPPSEEVKARLQQLAFSFAELKQEHDAAERVKREAPILVILGNPPYNGFAGVAVGEERDLSNAYRTTIKAPPPQGQGLNELYIRFYRMAERRIVEMKGEGVVSFISNYSWLDSLSCPGMRERYLQEFDCIWIDSLNGDKYRTGKLTPDEKPDPSVFSTEFNREGIQVGTAISVLVRKPNHKPTNGVQFREWWGKEKRADLLASVIESAMNNYELLVPELRLGLPFRPAQLAEDYDVWPLLPQLMPISYPGIKTSRDDFVVDIDYNKLLHRLELYFDPNVTDDKLSEIAGSGMESSNRFDAVKVRQYLMQRGFLRENVVRFMYRPFDLRWLYWEPETNLVDRSRPEYFPHVFEGNVWLAAVQQNRKEFDPPVVTSHLGSLHLIERGANLFPLLLRNDSQQSLLASEPTSSTRKSNLSDSAKSYLEVVGADDATLFHHILAVLNSRNYALENLGALRQNWPRIPLPSTKEALTHSAEIGSKIGFLLNPESPVDEVTTGSISDPFRSIGMVSHIEGKALRPDEDLKVTKNWGYRNKAGAIMPGGGKAVGRHYAADERDSIRRAAQRLGFSFDDTLSCLGNQTYDVYLNDVAFWKNIPSSVWDYTIGGYQVMKKWLSYREIDLLGRPLSPEEAREVMNIARRIAAIILLQPLLDANYETLKSNTYPWH